MVRADFIKDDFCRFSGRVLVYENRPQHEKKFNLNDFAQFINGKTSNECDVTSFHDDHPIPIFILEYESTPTTNA
jgi:hypothetical protein